MLNHIFIIMLSITSLVALEDLGTYDGTKTIEGKSFSDEINERIKSLDVKKIEEQMIKEKKSSYNLGKNLPECSETVSREYVPEITFSEELVIPYSREILFKKGEKVNILKHLNINFPYYLVFADADSLIQKKLVNALSQKSMIMFVNGDISDYIEKDQQIFIARKELEVKSFNIRCLPSIVAQNGEKFVVNEYNPNELVKKD